MTLSLKHKFTSAIPDAGDPTIVQPSNWNDEHALTQATATILGRVSALTGATEELTPAQARTLLNVADGATANSTDAFLLARANHTGTESADVLTDGTTNKAFLATERTKLAGIATGADVTATALNATAKGTPVDADRVHGSDSAASFGMVYATWTQVKAFLKTYFDTLYQPLLASLTSWGAITRAAGFDTFATTPSSANLRALLSDEVGTGAAYFVGGALGTPASGTATNLTGLPVSTGISGLGTGVATFLATPSSANLAAALTDETGTGAAVFATSPVLVTPALGTPSALVLTNATGLPIAGGGTGQTTAAAAFDALAPTTTRGDLIFRNATTNTRLAAGTSGYALIAAGAGADPAWAGFVQTGSSPTTRTWQGKASDFVSILDFGAIGDGNIANAATNATALTNALATGKKVWIPYTAAGYHFGTNTITLATGNIIVGENRVTLFTTTTTMMFSCTGYGQEWGVSNVRIDATGCGSSSTIFRFRTASAVVYRGRFDNIDFVNQYEAFGDEASANYVVDIRFTNIAFLLSLGRPIYLRHSRGFIYWENIQHSLNTSARATSWECGRFEDAVGLEITRWDCSGGPLITNSTVTITIASPGVVTWAGHNLVVGDAIRLTTTGALPTGLAVATTYFVKTVVDANNFTLSATSGGAVINTSGTQSGTHTATRAAVYQSAAYGLVIATSTSVWLNRVEVDSTWGNGILLSTIRFLRTNQVSAYHNLGNQITCNAITESALSDTIITGAFGDIGDGNGGGLSFDTSSSNIGISNLDITNCSSSALILNNVTKVAVANYNGYSNAGYALALLGTTDLCTVSGGQWASNAGTGLLDSASGTKNVVINIAGYNPQGAAAVTTGASPYTYTAGRSPETLYFSASTGVSAVTQGGVSILPAALAANVPLAAQLGPNEAIIITYTGTLTAKKMVH